MEYSVAYSTQFKQYFSRENLENFTFLDLNSHLYRHISFIRHNNNSRSIFYIDKKSKKIVQNKIFLSEKYKPSLVSMMSFKDGIHYDSTQEFTKEEFSRVTPEHILRWIRLKVYRTPYPTFDQNPSDGRPSSLAYAKNEISNFMPNQLMVWNEISVPSARNPTKSTAVKNSIKLVKMKELCKEDMPS